MNRKQRREVTLHTERGTMKGYVVEADEVIRPGRPPTIVVVTHLEHPCFYCGKHGLNKYVGTFTNPQDHQEYPVCVCTEHEEQHE